MQSFLQSAEWEEIQKRTGRGTWRVSGALVIRHNLLGRFHYLYAPRPGELPDAFAAGGVELAGELGSLFLKIDPQEPADALPGQLAHAIQPPATVLVDLGAGDAALAAAMHEKTRYNIRLAERHGVRVEPVLAEDVPRKFNSFWSLLTETARREQFSLHPEEHYRVLLAVRSGRFSNELWCAELGGEPLACAIVNWFSPSGTATYLHGASSRARREVMAPHRLHGEIIRQARLRGFATYDFGGIDEVRWPGMARFKRGFGGRVVTSPPSYDLVFRPGLYQLYRFQRWLRHRL